MKLIPVISPRPGGRRVRRMPPLAIIAASLSVLFPLAAAAPASPAAASTAAGQHGGGSTASTAAASTAAASPSCPWLNQSLPISQRVHLLLSKMTLANEITMVEGQGTCQPYVFYMAAQPSLCIPAMGLEDGPLGVGDGLTGVTQLPSGASLAATFDTSLARRYGAVIGQEEWGKGAAVNLGPTVNILRDPRWGRSFEAFTEDPFLNAALAVSEIGGVQDQGEMSQVKHFAAYNQETNRNTPADDVIVSNRTLHEIYLPAFQQAVTRARVASVMCAYSVINGNFACQNPYLETQVLRPALGLPRLRDLRLRRPAQHPGGGRRHRHGAAVQHVLRPGAADRRGERDDPQVGGGHHGQPDRHRDVPLRDLQPPADRDHRRHRHHPGPPGGGGPGRRGRHRAAEERRRGPAAAGRARAARWR